MTKPRKPSEPEPAPDPDPIFAVIEEHKAATEHWQRLSDQLEEGEYAAIRTIDPRPWSLISWRRYSAIGGDELERVRMELLDQPGSDRDQIEMEYRDAKEREDAAVRAEDAWYDRAGLTTIREQRAAAGEAMDDATLRLATTKPATLVGIMAFADYLAGDPGLDECVSWGESPRAIVIVASALQSLFPRCKA